MAASGQADDFDEQFLAKLIEMNRASEPLARPSTRPRPAENKANFCVPGAPWLPPHTVAHPTPTIQLAKQSHGSDEVQASAAARLGVMTPRKIGAARLLLAGYGVVEVAAAVGVGRHTITRWTKDPAFQAEARRQIEAVVPLTKK